jgi:hypothetical protein
MAVLEKEILAKLRSNCQRATEMIPPDMVQEFQKKIIRPRDLEEYARVIAIAVEFKDETALQKIQNWMVERFSIGGFGRKLVASNTDPNHVYETLLSGIYDYK